ETDVDKGIELSDDLEVTVTKNVLITAEKPSGARLAEAPGEEIAEFSLAGQVSISIKWGGGYLSFVNATTGQVYKQYAEGRIPQRIVFGRGPFGNHPGDPIVIAGMGMILPIHAEVVIQPDGSVYLVSRSVDSTFYDGKILKNKTSVRMSQVGGLQSENHKRFVASVRKIRQADKARMDLKGEEALGLLDAAQADLEAILRSERPLYETDTRANLHLIEARRVQVEKLIADRGDSLDVYEWHGENQGQKTGQKHSYLTYLRDGVPVGSVLLFGRDRFGRVHLQKRGDYFGLSFPGTYGPTVAGGVRSEDENPVEAIKRVAREELGIELDETRLHRIVSATEDRPYDQRAYYRLYEFTALTEDEWKRLERFRSEIDRNESAAEKEPLKRVITSVHAGYRRMFVYVVDPQAESRLLNYAKMAEKNLKITPSNARVHRAVRASWLYEFTDDEIKAVRVHRAAGAEPGLAETVFGLIPMDSQELYRRFTAAPNEFSTDAFIPSLIRPDLREQFMGKVLPISSKETSGVDQDLSAVTNDVKELYDHNEIRTTPEAESFRAASEPYIRQITALIRDLYREQTLTDEILRGLFADAQKGYPNTLSYERFAHAMRNAQNSLKGEKPDGRIISIYLRSEMADAAKKAGAEIDPVTLQRYELAGLSVDRANLLKVTETADEIYYFYKNTLLSLFESETLESDPTKIRIWFSDPKHVQFAVNESSKAIKAAQMKRLKFFQDAFVAAAADPTGQDFKRFARMLREAGQSPQDYTRHMDQMLDLAVYLASNDTVFSAWLERMRDQIKSHVMEKYLRIPAERLAGFSEDIANQRLRHFAKGGMNFVYRIRYRGLEHILIRPQHLEDQIAKVEAERATPR
ncbi:MAG TPA: NUDIX domain-containing protein, partial [Candidatus Omnitrophota bacterium]|nr:NUDIX domain-containing protein [Candidatus Omnitrophota bacterium]